MTLEQRIRGAEAELFDVVGAKPDESFHELAATGLRVRVLAHGSGAPVVLLHGVSLGASCSRSTSPGTGCRTRRASGAVRSASTRAT